MKHFKKRSVKKYCSVKKNPRSRRRSRRRSKKNSRSRFGSSFITADNWWYPN